MLGTIFIMRSGIKVLRQLQHADTSGRRSNTQRTHIYKLRHQVIFQPISCTGRCPSPWGAATTAVLVTLSHHSSACHMSCICTAAYCCACFSLISFFLTAAGVSNFEKINSTHFSTVLYLLHLPARRCRLHVARQQWSEKWGEPAGTVRGVSSES